MTESCQQHDDDGERAGWLLQHSVSGMISARWCVCVSVLSEEGVDSPGGSFVPGSQKLCLVAMIAG